MLAHRLAASCLVVVAAFAPSCADGPAGGSTVIVVPTTTSRPPLLVATTPTPSARSPEQQQPIDNSACEPICTRVKRACADVDQPKCIQQCEKAIAKTKHECQAELRAALHCASVNDAWICKSEDFDLEGCRPEFDRIKACMKKTERGDAVEYPPATPTP